MTSTEPVSVGAVQLTSRAVPSLPLTVTSRSVGGVGYRSWGDGVKDAVYSCDERGHLSACHIIAGRIGCVCGAGSYPEPVDLADCRFLFRGTVRDVGEWRVCCWGVVAGCLFVEACRRTGPCARGSQGLSGE